MNRQILWTLILMLLAAAMPVILLSVIYKDITPMNAILSIIVSAGQMNFWKTKGRKQLIGQVVATLLASATMCLLLRYFGI